MSVKLKRSNVPLDSYEVTIEYPGDNVYTTHPDVKHGRWYYEYTHISGDFFHILGFRGIYTYQIGTKNLNIYGRINDTKTSSYIDTGMKVDSGETVGLGIDLDKKEFFVRFKDTVKIVRYSTDIERGLVDIWEANINGTKDTVKVNLGQESFAYGLPNGFCAWYSLICRPNTCIINKPNKPFSFSIGLN